MIYAFWSLVSAFVFLKGRLETETRSVLCAAVFCLMWREFWGISLLARPVLRALWLLKEFSVFAYL